MSRHQHSAPPHEPQTQPARLAQASVSAARTRVLLDGAREATVEDLLLVVAGRRLPPDSLATIRLGFGGLRGLGHRSARELGSLRGIGVTCAARIVAALELGRRAATERPVAGAIHSSADIFRSFRDIAHLEHETFWVLALDVRNRALRRARICEGTLARCVLRPADVLVPALRENAAAVIVVHNHPSGDPDPSAQDIALTRRLQEAAEVVGIRLLDHVVVGAKGYVSLRERGWMDAAPASASLSAAS